MGGDGGERERESVILEFTEELYNKKNKREFRVSWFQESISESISVDNTVASPAKKV